MANKTKQAFRAKILGRHIALLRHCSFLLLAVTQFLLRICGRVKANLFSWQNDSGLKLYLLSDFVNLV